jgi:demethylmenaquinone methyltransferase/2-methoxy-6-polyprenyl-1,4-benzoquinol methylase
MNAETLQNYYAARAPEYDRVYKKPERQRDLRLIERWLSSAFTARTTLELACGTGYWTRFIATTAKELAAIDVSAETLHMARARVKSLGVSFVLGDAYRLPVAARRFDAAFAGFWFSHVPRARAREFLRGLHRALVPGAKVVFLDNRFVPGSSTPIAEQDGDGNTYQLRRLEDGSTHRVLKNFPSESELPRAVAGLAEEIRFHEWQYFWAMEYVVATP